MRVQAPVAPPSVEAPPRPAPGERVPARLELPRAGPLLVAGLGLVVLAVGTLEGVWWLALPLGLLVGASRRGLRDAILTGLLVGLLGWLLPLAWLSLSYPIWRAGAVLAGILGLGLLGAPGAILLTALVGALLCGTGSWIGAALRRYALG